MGDVAFKLEDVILIYYTCLGRFNGWKNKFKLSFKNSWHIKDYQKVYLTSEISLKTRQVGYALREMTKGNL